MLIQQAQDTDSTITATLIKALIDELNGCPVEWDSESKETLCQDMIQAGDYIVFLAMDDPGQAAGLITLAESYSLYAGGKMGIIQELYVIPEMRSQKIGKSLIQTAAEYARDRKWKRLEVGAPAYPQWARTKDFYLREGFKEIGPRLKYEL